MTGIAADLGLNRQTLLRRLKPEGVSFVQILDDLLRKVAAERLAHGLSVGETACRVGFADPAPFSRAFRRWTGQSPREYAAAMREEPSFPGVGR